MFHSSNRRLETDAYLLFIICFLVMFHIPNYFPLILKLLLYFYLTYVSEH